MCLSFTNLELSAVPNEKNGLVQRSSDRNLNEDQRRRTKLTDRLHDAKQVAGWGFKPASYTIALNMDCKKAIHYTHISAERVEGLEVGRITQKKPHFFAGAVKEGG
jgi:hypothetical protein